MLSELFCDLLSVTAVRPKVEYYMSFNYQRPDQLYTCQLKSSTNQESLLMGRLSSKRHSQLHREDFMKTDLLKN